MCLFWLEVNKVIFRIKVHLEHYHCEHILINNWNLFILLFLLVSLWILYLYFPGCILENVQNLYAPIIKSIDLQEADQKLSKCAKLCREESECDNWTLDYGNVAMYCYLKDEGSFKLPTKSSNMKWTSGSKYCYPTGNK